MKLEPKCWAKMTVHAWAAKMIHVLDVDIFPYRISGRVLRQITQSEFLEETTNSSTWGNFSSLCYVILPPKLHFSAGRPPFYTACKVFEWLKENNMIELLRACSILLPVHWICSRHLLKKANYHLKDCQLFVNVLKITEWTAFSTFDRLNFEYANTLSCWSKCKRKSYGVLMNNFFVTFQSFLCTNVVFFHLIKVFKIGISFFQFYYFFS